MLLTTTEALAYSPATLNCGYRRRVPEAAPLCLFAMSCVSNKSLSQSYAGGCQSRTGRGRRSGKFEQLTGPGTCSKLSTVLVAGLLLLVSGCASVALSPSSWQLPSFSSQPLSPGTPGWWKKNKQQAELVPGEGFRVAGYEGYFDDQGRSIQTSVAKVVHQEKKDKGLLKDVNVQHTVEAVRTRVGLGEDQQLAQQAFSEGEDLFRSQQYAEAAKQFKHAIARGPGSQIEQDAMFYKAESLFYAKQYPDAVDAYEKLLKEYPNSSHLNQVVRRQFDIARYWEKHHQYKPRWTITPNALDETRPLFDTLGRALKTYENIRLNDPTGPLADDAIMATANSHFLRGRYEDADYHYQLLRREYPRSEHQYEAHILGLRCKLRRYQGPDYGEAPLQEAKKLVKQLKVQFGGELTSEQRDRLAEDQAEINQQLALRHYKMAKYYDDTKYYGSAKFYYAQIARDFPKTELATASLTRLAELSGKPDHPGTNVQWLLDLFPENAERTAIAQVPLIETDSTMRLARQPKTGDIKSDETPLRR